MLKITIKGTEHFNEADQTFSTVGDVSLLLEHSLVSLSKWESLHQIPFLSSTEKTVEQLLDYVNCMILTPGVPPETVLRLSRENITEVQDYLNSPQSATTFNELPEQNRRRPEVITAELIYFWMVNFQIPFECETWHLNRLFALIKICNIKNSKPTKRSARDVAQQQRELNAQRRAQYGTRG